MKKKILIVDDQPDVNDMLEELFLSESYDVVCANSAEEALILLNSYQADVVISDEQMPGMTGSELLAIVRKKYPDTIRIILTGHGTLEAAIRAINEGEIYRFFTKPCNVVELAATVRQAIRLKVLSEENDRLIKLVKKQFAMLEEIENQYPGITKVNRNSQGEIVFEGDRSDQELSDLLRKINTAQKARRKNN